MIEHTEAISVLLLGVVILCAVIWFVLQVQDAKQQAKELMEHMHGIQQAAGEQQMKRDQFGHQKMMDTWGQAHQLGQGAHQQQMEPPA